MTNESAIFSNFEKNRADEMSFCDGRAAAACKMYVFGFVASILGFWCESNVLVV